MFGERLKELREKQKLTQKELGEKLGLSARLISYYETNKNIPNDPTVLNNIASIFNVSLDQLLGDSGESASKIHKLAKKLIQTTTENLLLWGYFYPTDGFRSNSWEDSFSLNNPSNTSYQEGDTVIHDQTFYVSYKDGGYLLARIHNDMSNLYKTALFVYYNGAFIFYASDLDISIVEDLFLVVKNQVLGIDSFVDEFLDDKFGGPGF